MSIYVPIKNWTNCQDRWVVKSLIDEGNKGKVYKTCCLSDCDFVAKVQYNPDWREEYKYQQKAATLGLTIPILDKWKYEDDGIVKVVFVMRALRRTVSNRIASIYSSSDEYSVKVSKVSELLLRCIRILDKLLENGILYLDSHTENFMLDSINNIFIIDFDGVDDYDGELTVDIAEQVLGRLIDYFMIVYHNQDLAPEQYQYVIDFENAVKRRLIKDLGNTDLSSVYADAIQRM